MSQRQENRHSVQPSTNMPQNIQPNQDHNNSLNGNPIYANNQYSQGVPQPHNSVVQSHIAPPGAYVDRTVTQGQDYPQTPSTPQQQIHHSHQSTPYHPHIQPTTAVTVAGNEQYLPENIANLKKTIESMQAKGLTNDARYHQMVYMLQQAEQRMNNPQAATTGQQVMPPAHGQVTSLPQQNQQQQPAQQQQPSQQQQPPQQQQPAQTSATLSTTAVTNPTSSESNEITQTQLSIPQPESSQHNSQSAFTSPQLYQLRCQIVAYKLLSRQEPVPKPLMLATMGKRPNNNQQQQPQTSTSTPPVPSNNENAQPSASTTPDVPATDSNGEKPATTSNQVKPANDQTQQKPAAPTPPQDLASLLTLPPKVSKIAPVRKPEGLDPNIILKERENKIDSQIAQRIYELENLNANISDNLRVKALIELKALRLLGFQKQLRHEVVTAMKRETTLETALNVKAYKRVKRQSLREARLTEKLERAQKMELEKKKRQRHHEFLQSVLQHTKEFKDYHRENKSKLQKLNKAVLLYHANTEREQRKEEERIEKERMRRLMAEDEEGYRKLIDEKKDKRLAYLLSQTDEYIRNIVKLVKEHKHTLAKKKGKKRKIKQVFVRFVVI